MNGKNIGDIGEARVTLEFLKYGIEVFLPYGENTKIDLIANFNNKLNKIQIKTTSAIANNGTYKVALKNSSLRANNKNIISKYTNKDVDYFAIFCLERPNPILIPFDLLQEQSSVIIRYDNLDNALSTCHLEKDFLFEKILNNKSILNIIKENKIEIQAKESFCIDCGKPITEKAIRCRVCAAKERRKNNFEDLEKIISREELKYKIRNQSFCSIAKEYLISDNGIRKWCKKYNLPSKKTDIDLYSDEEWQKI